MFQQRRIQPDGLSAGDSFHLSRKVTARVLFPPRLFSASMADDQAYVVRLLVGPSTAILFMSDSGVQTERALLTSGFDLHSEIIVKGQHHSGKSASEVFLDAVRPRLIIATSRDFPEYERINDQWAEDVRAGGIKLFRQDESGAVTLRFRDNGWEAQSYLTGETFRSSTQ
jgi:beta-lactamase superfamily II metal-dependent hydrolase